MGSANTEITSVSDVNPGREGFPSGLESEKVGRPGLEPGTYGLKVRSSAIELATPTGGLNHHEHSSNQPARNPNGQCITQRRPTTADDL